MLQFSIISTSEFLYLITNHATDAIKAVIHTVNMKFRKLKKNNVRNTKTTRQLKQEVLELSSGNARRSAEWGSRTKEVLWT